MNYGLYLSAAGALTAIHRQDVIANNLANVNTVSFKPDEVYFRARLPERLESFDAMTEPQWLLEMLSGGKFADPTHTQFAQGDLTATGNPLDIALRGEGFFAVATGEARGDDSIRLTRDGRFTLNERGELVMATTGMALLDVKQRPITLGRGSDVSIDGHGAIREDGRLTARIGIVKVSDPAVLHKVGDNLYRAASDVQLRTQPANAQLEQGFVEASAVDPVLALNAMINATKAAQANAKMIQFHDSLMDQAINRFGRVA